MPSTRKEGPLASAPATALTLATVSFALSFTVWGLIGGLAPIFTGLYQLTASQTALLVAVQFFSAHWRDCQWAC